MWYKCADEFNPRGEVKSTLPDPAPLIETEYVWRRVVGVLGRMKMNMMD